MENKEVIVTKGYRFDDIYIDVHNRRLWRAGQLVPLNSKYFDVLLLLLRQNGQLIEKQQIFDAVWEGVIVTDAALTQCIKDIRRQLGDDAANPRYLKTVPKHGYIFIGQAIPTDRNEAPAISSSPVSLTSASEKIPHRPYKFLDYYTEQDAELFFGRAPEVETICSQILAHRTFILHGRSGVGKSSIVRAGLLPRLKAQGHQVFVIRSFTDPLQQMFNCLLSLIDSDSRFVTLPELIHRFGATTPNRFIIFFLDQFEEFFSLMPEATRQQFLVALCDLCSNESLPLRLVFALREDLLAEMSQLKIALPEIFYHEFRLKRLSRKQAALAIIGPAETMNCHYETALVNRLLDDLGEPDGIDPPQLQIVCDQLYDTRDANGLLTLAAYERLGAAEKIIAGYLERVLQRFNPADLQAAKEILKTLISPEGQRLVLRMTALHARLGNAANLAMIEALVAARVVRCRNQDGEGWIELSHDFLLPEVSRWLTNEERALKRARGLLERAMENFRTHQLLIDADTLDLLLPFGEQLRLSAAEAEVLAKSLLLRGRSLPEWLVALAPTASNLISEAANHPDMNVRLRAIEACRWVRHPDLETLLRQLSLWDRHLRVRKAASIALADWLGTTVSDKLYLKTENEKIGLLRRVVSLALIRDYKRNLLPLSRLALPVSLLIILALVWVRLRRDWPDIVRQTLSGAIGGATAGIIGGLMLGLALAMARHANAVETVSIMLVLMSLGFVVSAFGGLGVSFGMVAATHLAYRHSRLWACAGGALGGAIIGWSAHLVGVDILKTLFGQTPTGITGALEGGVIGAGLSLGALLTGRELNGARRWQRLLGAALGSMAAGIILTIIGGNLFSSSLELITRSFANSQIRMEPLATFFGEVKFGRTTQIVLGGMEGFLFGGCLIGGMEFWARQRQSD